MSPSTISLLLVVLHVTVGRTCQTVHQYKDEHVIPDDECILKKNNTTKYCSYAFPDDPTVLRVAKFAAKGVGSSCNQSNLALVQLAKVESINHPAAVNGLNYSAIEGSGNNVSDDESLTKGYKYHLTFIVNATRGKKCEIIELRCKVVIFMPVGCNEEKCLERDDSSIMACSKVHGTILGERCEYECGMQGFSYHWCYTSGRKTDWDYCSKDSNHTYYGEGCSGPCLSDRTTYFWCKRTFGGSRATWDTRGWWDYCSPDLPAQSPVH